MDGLLHSVRRLSPRQHPPQVLEHGLRKKGREGCHCFAARQKNLQPGAHVPPAEEEDRGTWHSSESGGQELVACQARHGMPKAVTKTGDSSHLHKA